MALPYLASGDRGGKSDAPIDRTRQEPPVVLLRLEGLAVERNFEDDALISSSSEEHDLVLSGNEDVGDDHRRRGVLASE